MASDELDLLQRQWNDVGEEDPLYGVLTYRELRGGKWDPRAFFDTGEKEISELLDALKQHHKSPLEFGDALDFGCGVGRLTRALAKRFRSATGVDIAPAMISNAIALNKEIANATFTVNQTNNLAQFPTGSFDFIYSNIVLQHMPPSLAKGYILEFVRLIRPGGVAVFQLPVGPAWTTRGALLRLLPAALVRLVRKRDMYAVSQAKVIDLVTSAGGTVTSVLDDSFAGPNWISKRYVVTR